MAAIVSLILLGVNAFVCVSFASFLGLDSWWLWQFIPAGVLLSFVASFLIEFSYRDPVRHAIYSVAAVYVGFLNFGFFAALSCWLLSILDRAFGWPVPAFDLGLICIGFAVLTTLYGLLNAAHLRVTEVAIALSNLPDAWQNRTVALVTDLHLGRIAGPSALRRVIKSLHAMKPGAVFISGDMFDGTTLGLLELVAPWRDFTAPRGIFYVTGNHEEFEDRQIYIDVVAQTGVRVLHNEKVEIDGLQVVGVLDAETRSAEQLTVILKRAGLDPQRPTILLAHQPVNLAVSSAAGVALQLSGHTHRGQIFPWNFLVRRIFGSFAYGLNRMQQMQIYTSSGAGAWGPPLRVGTRAEIVEIKLTREL